MKKPARRRADSVVAMPRPDGVIHPSSVGQQEIARRAFELYCARGGQDGYDLEDWLSAERELRDAFEFTKPEPSGGAPNEQSIVSTGV